MGVQFSGSVLVSSLPSGSIYGDFAGPVSPQIGTNLRYFTSSIRFTKLTLHTFAIVTNDIHVTVKVNGIPVSTIVLPTGETTQSDIVNISVINADYMTLDITSGTCSDLSVRLDY